MANYAWSEEKITKFIKQGRGAGEFGEYKPWLTVRDVPSTGRESRIKGKKTNRKHQLLSDLEKKAFVIYDWNDCVIDIREQYPILERDKTQEIAEILGFNHPKYPKTNILTVMTFDFLITSKSNTGEVYTYARSIKPFTKLLDERVVEKLLIEKYYAEQQNIEWGLITDKEIPDALVRNLLELRDIDYNINEEDSEILVYCLTHILNTDQSNRVIDTIVTLSQNLSMDQENVIIIIKHLIVNKHLNYYLMTRMNFHIQIWQDVLN